MGVAADDGGQQDGIQPPMGHMKHPSQAVGHGMTQAQPRLGKGHAGHGGRQVDLQPDLLPPGERGGQGRVGTAEGLPGIQIRHRPRPPGGVGLHRVGQHIEARLRDQTLGQLLQQVAVQNGQIRPQPLVHQGMLDPVVGQYGKIRHLRTGTGGGGNRREPVLPFGKEGHGLGAVQGAASPQRCHQIRPKIPEPGGALRRQLHRRVRLYFVKILHLRASGLFRHLTGHAVFHKIGIRHQKQPFRAQIPQCRHRSGSGNDLCLTGEFLHVTHRLFRGSISRRAEFISEKRKFCSEGK